MHMVKSSYACRIDRSETLSLCPSLSFSSACARLFDSISHCGSGARALHYWKMPRPSPTELYRLNYYHHFLSILSFRRIGGNKSQWTCICISCIDRSTTSLGIESLWWTSATDTMSLVTRLGPARLGSARLAWMEEADHLEERSQRRIERKIEKEAMILGKKNVREKETIEYLASGRLDESRSRESWWEY